ncbi:MAG: F0F1 ATP synthase subunit gamma [Rhodospirillales bacterium]|nr:MAG: F0F1 ATP synthase subunit gamma [Rhodospirillales bacterium]
MPSLKDLRNRINSVKSTQKITSAMKMVAASKLKKAEIAAAEGRPYAERMERMLADLIATMPNRTVAPMLLAGTGKEDAVMLVVVGSDRGLCGGYNNNVLREARRQIVELTRQGRSVKLLCVGRKASDSLRRDHRDRIVDTLENVTRDGADYAPARDLARRLRTMFGDGEFDVCYLIYNRFKSAVAYEVTVKQIIPFPEPQVAVGGEGGRIGIEDARFSSATYDLEPSEDQLLGALLPANVAVQVFGSLLESYASEQGARMTAMDNATRNAGEMIEKLTLTYNRTRQAAITTELVEIISGAEAL